MAHAIPVLPVADLVRSAAWYERLGFEVLSIWDAYAILRFDDAEVHLTQLADEGIGQPSWSGAYLRVADVDAVNERWIALGAPVVAPVADRPWGVREFATEDLDGNLWRIGTLLGDPEESDADEGASGEAPGADEPTDMGAMDGSDGSDAADPSAPGELAPAAPAMDARPADGSPGTGDEHWFAIVSGTVACAGCGMIPSELPARALGAEVRDIAHALGEQLRDADDDAVRRRGRDGSWSALEYGVHVRDALSVFADRIVRTLAQDRPELSWWDHEEVMADGMANESDVGAVADDLGRNASNLSQALRMVTDDDWEKGASLGGELPVTVELLARIALHETVHHRLDATQALAPPT